MMIVGPFPAFVHTTHTHTRETIIESNEAASGHNVDGIIIVHPRERVEKVNTSEIQHKDKQANINTHTHTRVEICFCCTIHTCSRKKELSSAQTHASQ